jgi:GNAT superfamily N-acetyltransferase
MCAVRTVTIFHLEMTDPAQLRPARYVPEDVGIRQAGVPSPEFNRFLYASVGGDWFWTERLGWTCDHWLTYLDRPELETWVVYGSGTPAGYVELERQPGANVEIAYFGLLPQFVGRGIGGYFLYKAIERAWQMEARRVWVHTCTLDHPNALANYQARGLRMFAKEDKLVVLPDAPLGPWPGARRSVDQF